MGIIQGVRGGQELSLIAREQGGDIAWAESLLRQYIERMMREPTESHDIRQRPPIGPDPVVSIREA